MNNMKTLTDNNFAEVIESNELPVIVDFAAEWCAPCRKLTPILEELSVELKEKAVIAKFNIEENPKTPSQFAIRSIPTILIFKNGKKIDEKVGSLPKEKLLDWILETI